MKKATKRRFKSTISERTKKPSTRRSLKGRVAISKLNRVTEYEVPLKLIDRLNNELKPYKIEGQTVLPIGDLLEVLDDGRPTGSVYFRGLRQRENLTQTEMAEALGVTQSNISEYESGKRSLGKRMAKRIAARFGIDYRLLL